MVMAGSWLGSEEDIEHDAGAGRDLSTKAVNGTSRNVTMPY